MSFQIVKVNEDTEKSLDLKRPTWETIDCNTEHGHCSLSPFGGYSEPTFCRTERTFH